MYLKNNNNENRFELWLAGGEEWFIQLSCPRLVGDSLGTISQLDARPANSGRTQTGNSRWPAKTGFTYNGLQKQDLLIIQEIFGFGNVNFRSSNIGFKN